MIRSAPSTSSALVPITLRSGDKTGVMWVLWPAPNVESMLMESVVKTSGASGTKEAEGISSVAGHRSATTREAPRYQNLEEGIGLLPSYSRSLLRIRVPVTVTLAAAKQSLDAILNIGAGSIIHFNKSCEDTLTLEVAGHKVAVGETVKVGDKFGLWITAMILPDERFWVLSGCQPPVRAK
jgi:flagellar motor switch protein FliN/FliY